MAFGMALQCLGLELLDPMKDLNEMSCGHGTCITEELLKAL